MTNSIEIPTEKVGTTLTEFNFGRFLVNDI